MVSSYKYPYRETAEAARIIGCLGQTAVALDAMQFPRKADKLFLKMIRAMISRMSRFAIKADVDWHEKPAIDIAWGRLTAVQKKSAELRLQGRGAKPSKEECALFEEMLALEQIIDKLEQKKAAAIDKLFVGKIDGKWRAK